MTVKLTDKNMIDLTSQIRKAEPLYQVVEKHLRELINSGELIPGDLIPSEPKLAKQLNVSQGTVKKAIDNLVWQGLLYRHQGKGTFVSRIDFNNSLFKFFSYGDQMGHAVRVRKQTTDRHLEQGSVDIRKLLGVSEEQELLYIERIGTVESVPGLIEYSWWDAELVPGLENEQMHIPDLFYALIEEKFQIPVIRAEETLTAEACDEYTASKLEIENKAPVVVLNRITYSSDNRVIEVRTSKGRADMFSYKREIR